MKIQLCRHVKGLLPDEVIELDLPHNIYQTIVDHPLVTLNGTTYQRDSRDRSVYFDVEVLDLSRYAIVSDIK